MSEAEDQTRGDERGHAASCSLKPASTETPVPSERCETCGSDDPAVPYEECDDGSWEPPSAFKNVNPCPDPFHDPAPEDTPASVGEAVAWAEQQIAEAEGRIEARALTDENPDDARGAHLRRKVTSLRTLLADHTRLAERVEAAEARNRGTQQAFSELRCTAEGMLHYEAEAKRANEYRIRAEDAEERLSRIAEHRPGDCPDFDPYQVVVNLARRAVDLEPHDLENLWPEGTPHDRMEDAEAQARAYREALERIAANPWAQPATVARTALDPTPTKEDE